MLPLHTFHVQTEQDHVLVTKPVLRIARLAASGHTCLTLPSLLASLPDNSAIESCSQRTRMSHSAIAGGAARNRRIRILPTTAEAPFVT